jgi:hypothetical protein
MVARNENRWRRAKSTIHLVLRLRTTNEQVPTHTYIFAFILSRHTGLATFGEMQLKAIAAICCVDGDDVAAARYTMSVFSGFVTELGMVCDAPGMDRLAKQTSRARIART